ncbi:hypothetical protein [Microbacterium algeriense]|uniref:Uncharacterized protein n=1 Tax=Microbacterium algeriense TaxID=2615184 RepID=A0ABQ6VB37_9MICO|nr:hypothetical protein [Microbacterium algeriense]KAB1867575.1 hypothetical protein F6A08_07350 [Microbacterium algeriense]
MTEAAFRPIGPGALRRSAALRGKLLTRALIRLRACEPAVALAAAVTGCAMSSLPIAETVGKSLEEVSEHVGDTTTLLTQDVSPRVGLEATYQQGGDDTAWIVVASCADDAVVDSATMAEVAVIPKRAYTAEVRSEIADDDFADAVSCDGLSFR